MTNPPRRPWQGPWTLRRAWDVASWVLVAVLLVVVVRRLVPDLDLPDLGPAPDVTYATMDGSATGPADHRGSVVVLNVWATWCPPCVAETPGLVGLSREFAGDVVFLGLSQDADTSDVRTFARRFGVPYDLLVGAPRAGSPPSTAVLPTTYVIDRAGRVRMRHEGLLLSPALRPALKTLVRERG